MQRCSRLSGGGCWEKPTAMENRGVEGQDEHVICGLMMSVPQ